MPRLTLPFLDKRRAVPSQRTPASSPSENKRRPGSGLPRHASRSARLCSEKHSSKDSCNLAFLDKRRAVPSRSEKAKTNTALTVERQTVVSFINLLRKRSFRRSRWFDSSYPDFSFYHFFLNFNFNLHFPLPKTNTSP